MTGVLVYKYQAGLAEAQDVYADSVLRFREQVQKGGLTFGNLRAYLTRIAVNLCLEQRRGIQSELKRCEAFFRGQSQQTAEDPLVAREEADATEQQRNDRLTAIQTAMKALDRVCRELLTDSIAKGIAPRFLAEKYGFKNARVVTDKKARCKKQLKSLVQEYLDQRNTKSL